MRKRIRVSYNLKEDTIKLVKLASDIFDEDMSTIVDQALQFRLNFILKEFSKKSIKIDQESNEKWFEEFWNKAKKEINKNE